MKQVQLTQGKVALVDDEDFDRVSAYTWHAFKNKPKEGDYTWYAKHSFRRPDGTIATLLLHRFILNASEQTLHVDHEDNDGLNNQKSNLRLCTRSQNMGNRKPNKNATSAHKGVNWNARKGKWIARIGYKNKRHHLGEFLEELQAAQAYDQKARELFGEFARLNCT